MTACFLFVNNYKLTIDKLSKAAPLLDEYDRKTVSVNLDRLKELQGELSS